MRTLVLLLLAIPSTLAAATENEPPPEDFWLEWLWVLSSLCIVFALYLLAASIQERIKKHRREKSRFKHAKVTTLQRSNNKSE